MLTTNHAPPEAPTVTLTATERGELADLFDRTEQLDLSQLSTLPAATTTSPRSANLLTVVALAFVGMLGVLREAVCWACTGLAGRFNRAPGYLARYRTGGKHRVARSILHLSRQPSTSERVKQLRAAREADQEGDLRYDEFVSWVRLYFQRERDIDEFLHPLAYSPPRHLTC